MVEGDRNKVYINKSLRTTGQIYIAVIQVCSCEELKGRLPMSYLFDTQMWQERTSAVTWRPNPDRA